MSREPEKWHLEAAKIIYDDMANPDSPGMSVNQMAKVMADHAPAPTAQPAREFPLIPDDERVKVLDWLQNKGKRKHDEPRVTWGDIAGWVVYYMKDSQADRGVPPTQDELKAAWEQGRDETADRAYAAGMFGAAERNAIKLLRYSGEAPQPKGEPK